MAREDRDRHGDCILDRKTVPFEPARRRRRRRCAECPLREELGEGARPPHATTVPQVAQVGSAIQNDIAEEETRRELLHERLSIIENPPTRPRLSSEERVRRQRSDRTLFALLQQMKCARLQAGYSQAEFAQQLCTTRSAISRLESGLYSRPTLTTIENYAQVLGFVVEIRLVRVARPLWTVPHMRRLCSPRW